MKLKVVTLLAILLNSVTLLGQKQLSGTVFDAVTQKPLYGATVLIEGTSQGTSTTTEGTFELNVPDTVFVLNVSYVGYKTRKISIRRLTANEPLKVFLSPKTTILREFSVTGKKVELAYDKPEAFILDYELIDGNMLLLLKEKKKTILRLADVFSTTLMEGEIHDFQYALESTSIFENEQQRKHLMKESTALFKDYGGHVHLITLDSITQLFVQDEKVINLETYTPELFERYVLPCILEVGDYLILQQLSHHNQAITYYAVHTQTKEKKLIYQVFDESVFHHAQYYYNRSFLNRNNGDGGVMGEINIKQLGSARDMREATFVYKSVLSVPHYSPLMHIRDSLYLFNHLTDSMLVFDQHFVLHRSIPITHHQQKGWEDRIVVNEEGTRLYGTVIRGGIVYLQQLNLDNGKIDATYKLEEQTFPEKVRVSGDYAYYLYKRKENFTKKYLYKQRIH